MSEDNGSRPGGFSRETVMATNAMLALASAKQDGPVQIRTITEATGSDLGELSAVFGRLQKAGLVEPSSNETPGFRLAFSPGRVTLYDIAMAVGEQFELCSCGDDGRPDSAVCARCPLESVSRLLKADMVTFFKSRTIGDLVGHTT